MRQKFFDDAELEDNRMSADVVYVYIVWPQAEGVGCHLGLNLNPNMWTTCHAAALRESGRLNKSHSQPGTKMDNIRGDSHWCTLKSTPANIPRLILINSTTLPSGSLTYKVPMPYDRLS